MAVTFPVQTAVHNTTGAATVKSTSLSSYGKSVQIIHRGLAANPIYFTVGPQELTTPVNGMAGVPDPVVAGNDCFVVVAGTASNPVVIGWPGVSGGQRPCVIKTICAADEPFSIQVVNEPFGS